MERHTASTPLILDKVEYMRGDFTLSSAVRRYWKFSWNDLTALPAVGAMDYQPKGRAFRMFAEGMFTGMDLEIFPIVKTKKLLPPFGRCLYCDRNRSAAGDLLKLTSEHIIPEFLGAGLELPEASCGECQKVTSTIEDAIAREMFNPVRKSFALKGKNGVLPKTNFPLDVGRKTTEHEFIPLVHYPTTLVMPRLYPTSTYSRRPINSDDPFNFQIYNINANTKYLRRYSVNSFSTQTIDMVRFSQLIAKIAHAYAMHYFRTQSFTPSVADFIRTDYPDATPVSGHLEHVGCLWQRRDEASDNLHEVEVGTMTWNGDNRKAVRVRLFACCGMPSYYITVGSC